MFFQLSTAAAAITDESQQHKQHFSQSISPFLGTAGSLQNTPMVNLSSMVSSFYQQPLAHFSPTLFLPSLLGGTTGSFMNSLITAASSVPPQHRKLFIGGLNHETSDDQLREYYSQWGQVVDCIVIRDPVTRQSRGFGFVTFATMDMADAAMADRPHTVGGKLVDPKRAIPREQMLQATNYPPAFLDMQPPSDCKLYITGIHCDFHTVDVLRHYFEHFGEIEQVEIDGQNGFGFVVYEEKESVKKCLSEGKWHLINGRRVEIRESDRERNSDQDQSLSPPMPTFRSSFRRHSSRNYHKRGVGREKFGNSIGSHESQSHSPESTSTQSEG